MNTNRQKSIARLKQLFAERKLGARLNSTCMYANGEKRCAVGAMFNDAQLADLKKRGLNSNTPIDKLAREIGKKNIEYVTGFSLNTLRRLQDLHDHGTDCGALYHPDFGFAKFIAQLK